MMKNIDEQCFHDALVLGVRVDATRLDEVVKLAVNAIERRQQLWITTPNPEITLAAARHEEYRSILNSSDLAIADGVGLLAAAQYASWKSDLQKQGSVSWIQRLWLVVKVVWGILVDRSLLVCLPEQVSGDELVGKLLVTANEKKWRVFLLGGQGDTAAQAEQRLREKFPDAEIVSDPGAVIIRAETEEERARVIERIEGFSPHLLFVGYGAPWQELWLYKNRQQLQTHVMIGVGGTLDVLAGKVIDAPRWMRARGLKWLWRLVTEPTRLPRIWKAVAVFGWKVFSE